MKKKLKQPPKSADSVEKSAQVDAPPVQEIYESPVDQLMSQIRQLNHAMRRAYNSGLRFTAISYGEEVLHGHITPPHVVLTTRTGEPSTSPNY